WKFPAGTEIADEIVTPGRESFVSVSQDCWASAGMLATTRVNRSNKRLRIAPILSRTAKPVAGGLRFWYDPLQLQNIGGVHAYTDAGRHSPASRNLDGRQHRCADHEQPNSGTHRETRDCGRDQGCRAAPRYARAACRG